MMSETHSSPNHPHRDRLRERVRLRQKRKTTSCWPCRDRKVRCDKAHPCDICVKRGYPDLCSYESTTSHDPSANPQSGSGVSRGPNSSDIESSAGFQHSRVDSKTDLDSATSIFISTGNREPFLGENAIPSFARDQTGHENGTATRSNVVAGFMPIIGAENDSAERFLPVMADRSNIQDALPPDRDIIKIFQCFRTQLYNFTPILADIDLFERELGTFVDHRSNRRTSSSDLPATFSLSWIGQLYAVLASGIQFSDLSGDQRRERSSTFLQYSLQALRLASFLVRPTVECLQAFIILGNVLQNLMKPEAAWILLGTTVRIAQSLGIHQQIEMGSETQVGRRLWRNIVWQDTLLSLCFDRPPAAITRPPTSELSVADDLTYYEAMYGLQQCALDGMETKRKTPYDFNAILAVANKIEQLYDRVQHHLHTIESCSTFQQRCEHYALRLHTSFVLGWLSRTAFKRGCVAESQRVIREALIVKGKEALVRSLRAYLNLHPLCLQASRAWAYIHNGLSSALVLGLLGETKINPEVRELQRALIDILSCSEDNGNDQAAADGTVTLSKLHGRALAALKALYNDQSRDEAPLSAIPDASSELQSSKDAKVYGPRSEFSAYPVDFPEETQANRQATADNIEVADAWEISPMELFDSIIWDPNFSAKGLHGLAMDADFWSS